MPIIPILFVLAFRMRRVVYPSQLGGAGPDGRDGRRRSTTRVTGVRVVKGLRPGGPRARPRVTSALGVLFGSRMRNLRLRSRRTSTLQTIPQLGQVGRPRASAAGSSSRAGSRSAPCSPSSPTSPSSLRRPARWPASSSRPSRPGPAPSGCSSCSTRSPTWPRRPTPIELRRDRGRDQLRGRLVRLPALRAGARRLRPRGARRARPSPSSAPRARASRPSGCCCRASTTSRRARSRSTAIDVRDVTFDSLRRQIGVVFEDSLPLLRHDPGQHRLRPARRDRRGDRGGRAGPPRRTSSSRRCPTATTPSSASGACCSRAASASASRSPGRCSPTRGSCSSTTPPPRSTAAIEEEIHATLRRLMVGPDHDRSSPTAARRCASPTASSCSTRGRWSTTGTHEELLGRCPLYRELLAGPGDDAEGDGVDLGARRRGDRATRGAPSTSDVELDGVRRRTARPRSAARARRRARPAVVAAAAWAGECGPRSARRRRQSCCARSRPCRRSSTCPTSTSTEENRRRPPAVPVPPATSARSSRSCSSASLLVLLDAAAGLVGPSFTGTRRSHSVVLHHERRVLWVLSGALPRRQLLDWVDMWAETFWTGRTSERLLYAMRVQIFAHLQRLGDGLLRPGDDRPDPDPHDLRRRHAVPAAAVRARERARRTGPASSASSSSSAYPQRCTSILVVLSSCRRSSSATVVLPASSRAGPTTASATGSRRSTPTSQENVSGVRVTQAFRREGRNTAQLPRPRRPATATPALRSPVAPGDLLLLRRAAWATSRILIVLGVGRIRRSHGCGTLDASAS